MSRIRLTDLIGQPVAGPSGRVIGRVGDVVVRLLDGAQPTATGGVLRLGEADVFVPVAEVTGLDGSGLRLAGDRIDARPFERRPGEVLLDRDVRGRDVIDVDRARLIRVGDLVLEGEGADWRVVAVQPAVRTSFATAVRRLFGRLPPAELEVDWHNVEPLVGHVPTASMNLSKTALQRLKPAEIADIVEAASHEQGEEILEAVGSDEEFEADVFEELDEKHRLEFLKERSDEETAELLAKMDPDQAADLLMQLPQERRLPLLNRQEPAHQAKIRSLLGYGADTAGGLMNNEFLARPVTETVAATLALIRGTDADELPAILTDVYVLDGERLAGSAGLAALIRADPASTLADVMQPDPEAVFADADLPSVAVHMADFDLASLAVIDSEGRLLGIVTYDDLVKAMLPEEWRWRGGPEQARLEGRPAARAAER